MTSPVPDAWPYDKAVTDAWPYGKVAYQSVGCAVCHKWDLDTLGPLMFTLPPMDYPGLRDARIEMRLHDGCHALLVNVIGAIIMTGIRE